MSLFLNFNAHPTRLQPNEDQVGAKQEHVISQVRDTMAFGPRHFVAPAAAFTMAVTVVFYVKYTISTARAESHIRRSDALRPDRDDEPKRVERSQKSWRGGTCLSSYGNWEADPDTGLYFVTRLEGWHNCAFRVNSYTLLLDCHTVHTFCDTLNYDPLLNNYDWYAKMN